MRETVIEKLERLSENQLSELSEYIDFIEYKSRTENLKNQQNLLNHFNLYKIPTWKYLASAVRNSGIAESGAGYMNRETVINWLSLTYDIEYKIAKETLNILTRSGLLDTSSNGNIA